MSFFEVRNLTKHFGGLAAVDNVDFDVEEGEIFGLIGPNGSGKTTIFNLINRFFPVTRGSVKLEGRELTGYSTHKICKLGVGRTFQVVKPLSRMSVFENVLASAFLRHARAHDARDEAAEWLDFCNLEKMADQTAGSLPIASRKRLEIARALATEPMLLLLDETAAGLNPGELDEAIELIGRIRDKGVTIIVVEHIMKVIMTISDRILAINQGREITIGTPEEVAKHPEVIAAYLGEQGGH